MIPSLDSIFSRLRLRQLRLLIELDRCGSLHKAAEAMAISQPGATKALREVEEVLGVALFQRQPSGLVANDVGRCVVRYARLIHSDLGHLREEVLGIVQGQGGRLAVGSIMGAMPTLVSALGRLRRKQPQLAVEIAENTSANLLAKLDEGRLDLAICRPGLGRNAADYAFVELAQEPLAVVAHPQHPLAGAKALAVGDLSQYRWVVYPANTPMRQALERELSEAGVEVPRHPLETFSTFATFMLLQDDPTLVAVIPSAVAAFAHQRGLLVSLAVQLRALSEPFGIVHRVAAPLSPTARLLVDELTAN
ncbi:LysR family transcriptional regulator [Pseudomonas sp. S37]|uniref:LysR family transcriptional regulator n=1 Tax=Pseudomonas sp. S37 TaxID=2767449 RepID=UPI0019146051|nr:LysR family transcriptional regulator [Pseudomonas sp. S37]MBK4996084.1 LysR family transcriptional regulator [Pseudomonas sp. S37]